MRLYYFTTAEHGLAAVRDRKLKISRFHEVNDPFDLLPIDLSNPVDRKAFLHWRDQLGEISGMLCFSEFWYNPLMWAHYSKNHTGLCLGFDISAENMKVIYGPNRLNKAYFGITDWGNITENQMQKILSYKYSGWEYENERRIFINLDDPTITSDGNILYFIDFSSELKLTEIFVGMDCKLLEREVSTAAKTYGSEVITIRVAMSNSEYKMVPAAS